MSRRPHEWPMGFESAWPVPPKSTREERCWLLLVAVLLAVGAALALGPGYVLLAFFS